MALSCFHYKSGFIEVKRPAKLFLRDPKNRVLKRTSSEFDSSL